MIWQNRILRAYGTSLLGVFSGLLSNLWLLREITRHVSGTDLGIYAFVLQISSYLGILQLGLDFAASRQIAESLGKQDPSAANRAYWELKHVNRFSVWIVALGVISISLAFWCGIGLPRGSPLKLAAQVALLAGTAQTIAFLSRPYSAALIGGQYFPTVNLITVGRTIATSLVAYFILITGHGVLSVPAAELCMQAGAWIALSRLCRTRCMWRSERAPKRDPVLRRSVLTFGGLSTVAGFAWTIESTSDVVIIGSVAGPTVVAAYVLWWRFPQMLFDLCARLAYSAYPTFAYSASSSMETFKSQLVKILYLTAGLAGLAFAGVGLLLPRFVDFWVGPAYALPQPFVVAVAAGGLVFLRCIGQALNLAVLARGSAKPAAGISVTQAVLKVVVAWYLYLRIGIPGLLLGSSVATLFQVVVYSTLLLRWQLLDFGTLSRTALIGVSAALVAWPGPMLTFITTVPRFVLTVFFISIFWATIWTSLVGSREFGPVLRRTLSGSRLNFLRGRSP
jgi:O-antigen/teichoic acid export membrane protein